MSETTVTLQLVLPAELHPETQELVKNFAEALGNKLRKSEIKYGYGNSWKLGGWMDECREKLIEHLKKGDPRDVAAYCAFLWFHNESTKGECKCKGKSSPKNKSKS